MNDSRDTRPKVRSDITVQAIGDEVMLYDSSGEKIHVLNHSAHSIWKLCNGVNNLKDIYREMALVYPDAGAVLVDDINVILEEFRMKGLLI